MQSPWPSQWHNCFWIPFLTRQYLDDLIMIKTRCYIPVYSTFVPVDQIVITGWNSQHTSQRLLSMCQGSVNQRTIHCIWCDKVWTFHLCTWLNHESTFMIKPRMTEFQIVLVGLRGLHFLHRMKGVCVCSDSHSLIFPHQLFSNL